MAGHAGEPTITFHGAAGTVTGSCMELSVNGHSILVDCGMFQGSRSLEALNREDFVFDTGRIEAVVLTHAHIDHCGLLPKLAANGYDRAIWCTQATADLLEYMLSDAGRIQESEASRRNSRRDRAGETEFVPLYTERDALRAWGLARPVALGEWFEPAPGFQARLWNAGHILGAASVEIRAGDAHLLFSGDIGPSNKAFEPDPAGPSGLDHVVCESTYGNRARARQTIEQRRASLETEVKSALSKGGNLIIPVFALERTQELLLDLATLADAGRIPNVPIFVDSPLAGRATRVFEAHAAEIEDVGDGQIFRHPAIRYVADTSESIRLNQISGAIILAASGMCEAGRIRHHLKHNLHRRESTVLFVGFQAKGSLGRVILDGAKRVRISGDDVNVRACIRRIDSYSAHADRDELHDWIKARRPIVGSLFLSHGEIDATRGLRDLAQADDPAANILLPQIGEKYALPAGQPARRLDTARPGLEQITGEDWQNDYARFITNLKHDLTQIENERARREALRNMRAVLDGYRAFQRDRKRRRAAGSAAVKTH